MVFIMVTELYCLGIFYQEVLIQWIYPATKYTFNITIQTLYYPYKNHNLI